MVTVSTTEYKLRTTYRLYQGTLYWQPNPQTQDMVVVQYSGEDLESLFKRVLTTKSFIEYTRDSATGELTPGRKFKLKWEVHRAPTDSVSGH